MSDEEEKEILPEKRPGKRFGDDEVGAILERAANMQEQAVTKTDGSSGGLTLQDLREIAEEAGIDPRFVDLATVHQNAPVETKGGSLAGGAYSWQYQTSLDGEIDDRNREKILHAIRSVMGQKGELVDVYGRMEWSYDDGTGAVIIGITSHDGKTQIDVSAVKIGRSEHDSCAGDSVWWRLWWSRSRGPSRPDRRGCRPLYSWGGWGFLRVGATRLEVAVPMVGETPRKGHRPRVVDRTGRRSVGISGRRRRGMSRSQRRARSTGLLLAALVFASCGPASMPS